VTIEAACDNLVKTAYNVGARSPVRNDPQLQMDQGGPRLFFQVSH